MTGKSSPAGETSRDLRTPAKPVAPNKANPFGFAAQAETGGNGAAQAIATSHIVRNKANFPGPPRAASALRKESYGEYDPRRASEEQSQFSRPYLREPVRELALEWASR